MDQMRSINTFPYTLQKYQKYLCGIKISFAIYGKIFLIIFMWKEEISSSTLKIQIPDFAIFSDNNALEWPDLVILNLNIPPMIASKRAFLSRKFFRMSKWTMFKNMCQKWQLSVKITQKGTNKNFTKHSPEIAQKTHFRRLPPKNN